MTYNSSLKKRIINDGGFLWRWANVAKFHGIMIVVGSTVDTTHHTLIITEEEDGQASNAIDGDEKTSLLELVHHIEP